MVRDLGQRHFEKIEAAVQIGYGVSFAHYQNQARPFFRRISASFIPGRLVHTRIHRRGRRKHVRRASKSESLALSTPSAIIWGRQLPNLSSDNIRGSTGASQSSSV